MLMGGLVSTPADRSHRSRPQPEMSQICGLKYALCFPRDSQIVAPLSSEEMMGAEAIWLESHNVASCAPAYHCDACHSDKDCEGSTARISAETCSASSG